MAVRCADIAVRLAQGAFMTVFGSNDRVNLPVTGTAYHMHDKLAPYCKVNMGLMRVALQNLQKG